MMLGFSQHLQEYFLNIGGALTPTFIL